MAFDSPRALGLLPAVIYYNGLRIDLTYKLAKYCADSVGYLYNLNHFSYIVDANDDNAGLTLLVVWALAHPLFPNSSRISANIFALSYALTNRS